MLLVSISTQIKAVRSRARTLYRIIIKPFFLRRPILFICKKLGLNIVTRDDLVFNIEKYRVQYFNSKELVIATKPHTSREISKEISETIYPFTITIDEPFVCEVANAELAGPAAVGFDETGGVILETTTPIYSIKNHLEGSVSIRALALSNFSRSSVPQLHTACSLVNAWSKSYWHWMIDCLTRLEGIEFYHKQASVKPVILIDANPTLWQIDSLKLLGYGPDDCIQWNRSRMRVERLVVSSFRRHYNQVYSIESPLACRWIRQRMLSNIPSIGNNKFSFSSKIFISRRQAFGRRILNESDVMEVLATFGFIDYVLEEMSFLDQVRLFAQAKIIVAPHGAGLTNIIFSENLTIVELFGSSLPPCFANLSRGLGFKYGYLKCQSPHTGIRRQDSDMIVDVAELKNFVVKMLEY